MMKKRYLLSLCMAVLLAVELQAKVVLPALLCDNMVVQQNSVVCLWGKSDASVLTVKPSWTEKEYRTDVSGNGSFQLWIETIGRWSF